MITVGEFFKKIDNSDRLRIIQQGEDVFVGYLGVLRLKTEKLNAVKDKQIERFRVVPEITHKQWKERNLISPLQPEETADFYFRDLQMKLYYTIYL